MLGADIVIHSVTKYLAGHNDVLAGALAGSSDLVAAVRPIKHGAFLVEALHHTPCTPGSDGMLHPYMLP